MPRPRHQNKDIEAAIRGFPFRLTLSGVNEMTDEIQGKVLATGCDDALLCSRGEVVYLMFAREAEDLGDAIGSAVKAVQKAGFGVAKIEIDPN